MLTKIQLQNLDQTSANIVILLIWSKRNKRITSRVLWNVRARASYTCEHVLHACASTCLLHVRARYLFVRARLLFKNVRPGQLKTHFKDHLVIFLIIQALCTPIVHFSDHLYTSQIIRTFSQLIGNFMISHNLKRVLAQYKNHFVCL